MISVRDAGRDDLPAVSIVFRRSSWSVERDRPLLEQHPEFLEFSGVSIDEGRTRVAEGDGVIAGFSTIADRGTWWELEDLFVEPDLKRRGIGRALVADLVGRARLAGRSRIEVDANEDALAFYERVGFVTGHVVALEHGTARRMTLPVTSGRDSSRG